MKKSTLVLACLLGCSATFAQDLTSKKGETILPEAGDWSIGVDAAPFLNYFGRFLSNAGGTAPTFEFLDGSLMHIVGKRYVDETTAQRAILRLGFTSSSSTASTASKDYFPWRVLIPRYPSAAWCRRSSHRIRGSASKGRSCC